MPSKLREAALQQDLSSTLWRVGVTQDNSEFKDLLPEQLRMLLEKYPKDCQQYIELSNLLRSKEPAIHLTLDPITKEYRGE